MWGLIQFSCCRNYCLTVECEYYLNLDSDAHLDNPHTLRLLVEQNRCVHTVLAALRQILVLKLVCMLLIQKYLLILRSVHHVSIIIIII
jgi:hypothetical protein